MEPAIEQLQQLGFSQYEAQAYVTLLKQSAANGYELAKASGIPRANIYTVLQKLEDRGAVLRIDSPEGTRYAALDPQELLAHLKRQYQGTLEAVSSALSEVTTAQSLEFVSNMKGYAVMLEQARSMLETAQHDLLLGIWPDEALALAEPLLHARERGVQMTTLCLRGCPQPCPACQGNVFRYPMAPADESRWLMVIPDGGELMAGEIAPQREAQAVRTRQKMLVNLAAGYLQNSIALASILTDLDDRLENLLTPQTRRALDTLHPFREQGHWLDVMRTLIHSKENLQ